MELKFQNLVLEHGSSMINDVVQAVKDAADIGYRHINTAQAYGNESGVGEGIRTCSVNREDICLSPQNLPQK